MNNFKEIIGNNQAKEYLCRMISRGTIGNSLLFTGMDGIGKSLFASAFAKSVICQDDPRGVHRSKIESGNHPDIRVYRPEGKTGMHSIASLRHFNEEVYLSPSEAKWKVFIIHDADRMMTYSANALLKTFEEPPKNTIIILLSHSSSALLPTILSRCRTIYFHPLKKEEVSLYLIQKQGKSQEEADAIASTAQGSIGQALRLIKGGGDSNRTLILDLLANGGVTNYKELSGIANTIADHIDEAKKEVETEMRSFLVSGAGESPSAAHKQSIEKEVEGAASMYAMHESYAYFSLIVAWYRDMQLLSVNGNREHIILGEYADRCLQALQKGKFIPLERVQEIIQETRLALDRSTTLHICFENLFLKLNLI